MINAIIHLETYYIENIYIKNKDNIKNNIQLIYFGSISIESISTSLKRSDYILEPTRLNIYIDVDSNNHVYPTFVYSWMNINISSVLIEFLLFLPRIINKQMLFQKDFLFKIIRRLGKNVLNNIYKNVIEKHISLISNILKDSKVNVEQDSVNNQKIFPGDHDIDYLLENIQLIHEPSISEFKKDSQSYKRMRTTHISLEPNMTRLFQFSNLKTKQSTYNNKVNIKIEDTKFDYLTVVNVLGIPIFIIESNKNVQDSFVSFKDCNIEILSANTAKSIKYSDAILIPFVIRIIIGAIIFDIPYKLINMIEKNQKILKLKLDHPLWRNDVCILLHYNIVKKDQSQYNFLILSSLYCISTQMRTSYILTLLSTEINGFLSSQSRREQEYKIFIGIDITKQPPVMFFSETDKNQYYINDIYPTDQIDITENAHFSKLITNQMNTTQISYHNELIEEVIVLDEYINDLIPLPISWIGLKEFEIRFQCNTDFDLIDSNIKNWNILFKVIKNR